MAGEPVRIGLVGYGFGGRRFHAPFIAAAPECELVGVVTRATERRALIQQDLPGVASFDSMADVAAAGAEAVVISTPAPTHVDLVNEAIGRGLAVVCDKPFALDAPSAAGAVKAARKAGVALTVYQNRRWDSDLLTVRRLIAEDAIGRVMRFESRFERFRPGSAPKAAGGGALLEFGTHVCDEGVVLLGRGDRLHAEVHPAENGLDDDFFLALRHTGGVHSLLWGSSVQGAPGPRFRVTGTTGTFVVGGVDGQEQQLVEGRTPATEGDKWGLEPEERWGKIHRGDVAEAVPSERGRWDTFYPAFAAAIRGDSPVPVDPADAVHALEVLDRARSKA
jgi:predicted dehydrogenase